MVPQDKMYEGLVDADEDWCEVKPYDMPSYPEEIRFDYAPTRDLNETLKGLAV